MCSRGSVKNVWAAEPKIWARALFLHATVCIGLKRSTLTFDTYHGFLLNHSCPTLTLLFLAISSDSIIKLNDENYPLQFIYMRVLLIHHNIVSGTTPHLPTATTAKDQREYWKKVDMAQYDTVLSLEPSQLTHVDKAGDACVTWQNLHRVHTSCGFATSVALHRKYLTMSKSDTTSIMSPLPPVLIFRPVVYCGMLDLSESPNNMCGILLYLMSLVPPVPPDGLPPIVLGGICRLSA